MKRRLPESIKISLSCSFMARARCAKCGGPPAYYYRTRTGYDFKDIALKISHNLYYQKNTYRIGQDWFHFSSPRNCTKLGDFIFTLHTKSYNPRFHKNTKSPMSRNVVDALECDCGRTVWKFSMKGAEGKPEIRNRKARNNHPKQFKF